MWWNGVSATDIIHELKRMRADSILTTLVSVVIPVRNGREYIAEALQSVLNQTYTNLEIIVIDDGSDDFDYMTLQSLDSRIRVICLSGHGVSCARNIGMAASSGRYIAFLDADDVWFPGKLMAQIRYFEEHPEVGCVFGSFIKWCADNHGGFPPANSLWQDCSQVTACDQERSGWLYTRLLSGLLVGMNTAVIRREVFDLLGGFDESMRIGEDYLFWLKISRIFEMHALDAPVALYRIHSSSAMNRLDDDNHQARLLTTAFKRWGLANPDGTSLSIKSFRHRLALTEFAHGYNHYWHDSPETAMRAFKKSAAGGTLPARSIIYWLLSMIKKTKLIMKKFAITKERGS